MTTGPDVTPSDAEMLAYSQPAHLPMVRAFVLARAHALGLARERADLLTIAVNELVTNTLRHTTGGGSVRLWSAPGQFTCEVVDGGPIPTFGRAMPPPDAVGGRGLAMVERLCDIVDAYAGPDGTVIRLRYRT